jgi:hypothetical protein
MSDEIIPITMNGVRLYFDTVPNDLKLDLLYYIYEDYSYDDFKNDQLAMLQSFTYVSKIIKNSPTLWKNKYENEISSQIPQPPLMQDNPFYRLIYKNSPRELRNSITKIAVPDKCISYKTAYMNTLYVLNNINCHEYSAVDLVLCNLKHIDNIKLILGAMHGWEKVVENLINIGINPNPFPDYIHLNAIIYASLGGQLHIVKYLTSLPNVDFHRYYDECIYWASVHRTNDYVEVIRFFRELGVS